ncbi:MAG: hypothetical protein CL607_15730 [Anaerolineaceae bacterium]|nr:hypothetical protein [Anaerolineaceae bacterium]
MPEAVTLRILDKADEFSEVTRLHQTIWKRQPEDAISPYIMQTVSHNGGSVIGAEVANQLVGFTFCMVVERNDNIRLWSYLSGVHPTFQGQGIGHALKKYQRRWALERGHSAIAWTFDPMQRRNANFNFNHLGVVAKSYYPDYYGKMDDAINAGLATDRLEAIWQLDDPEVVLRMESGSLRTYHESPKAMESILVQEQANSIYWAAVISLALDSYYIEIPWNIGKLKESDMSKAREWQTAIRKALSTIFGEGYTVTGFIQKEQQCWYLAQRRTLS